MLGTPCTQCPPSSLLLYCLLLIVFSSLDQVWGGDWIHHHLHHATIHPIDSKPSSKKDDHPSYQIQSNPSSKKDGPAKVIESTITSMIEQPSFVLNPIRPQRKKDGLQKVLDHLSFRGWMVALVFPRCQRVESRVDTNLMKSRGGLRYECPNVKRLPMYWLNLYPSLTMSVYTIYIQGMETRVIGYMENTHKYMGFVE